jgi:hypothetical protein
MPSARKRRRAIVALLAGFGLTAAASCRPATSAEAPPPPQSSVSPSVFVSLAPDVHEPCGLATSAGAVWALGCSGSIVRMPAGGGASQVSSSAAEPVGLDAVGAGPDVVWLLGAEGEGADRAGSVSRRDPATGSTIGTIRLGSSIPVDAAAVGERLWIVTADGGVYFSEDDAATKVAGGPAQAWVLADTERLFTVGEDGDLTERSRADGAVKKTHRGVLPNAIAAAFGLGSIWLASYDVIVRVDPSSGRSTRVGVSGTVNDIEPCGEAVWLSQPDIGLRAVDGNGKVVRELPVVQGSRYLACDGSRLWVLTEDGRLGSIEIDSR